MGQASDTLTLYTAQAPAVIQAIQKDGVCFSRAEYVARKYQESAKIFLTAYGFFVQQAERLVPKPQGAEFPYWAFADLYSVDQTGAQVLKLEVPRDQVVLFDLYDWNKVLCMKYLEETPQEGERFRQELALRGLKEADVVLGPFYPALRQQIMQSWRRLFRHHARLVAGDEAGVGSVQAGLWQIKKEWIVG